MSLKNHLTELTTKHRALENELAEAAAHPDALERPLGHDSFFPGWCGGVAPEDLAARGYSCKSLRWR